jgi:hypothetical protein
MGSVDLWPAIGLPFPRGFILPSTSTSAWLASPYARWATDLLADIRRLWRWSGAGFPYGRLQCAPRVTVTFVPLPPRGRAGMLNLPEGLVPVQRECHDHGGQPSY